MTAASSGPAVRAQHGDTLMAPCSAIPRLGDRATFPPPMRRPKAARPDPGPKRTRINSDQHRGCRSPDLRDGDAGWRHSHARPFRWPPERPLFSVRRPKARPPVSRPPTRRRPNSPNLKIGPPVFTNRRATPLNTTRKIRSSSSSGRFALHWDQHPGAPAPVSRILLAAKRRGPTGEVGMPRGRSAKIAFRNGRGRERALRLRHEA